ncbi:hypothetical protein HPB47_021357, partial [Ixodes persulcatus]
MISLISAVTGVLLLFVSQASACDDQSCLNITLQNILGIGECLGTHGDVCSSESKGLVDEVTVLVECALTGLGGLDVSKQLHIAAEIIAFTLDSNGLGDLGKLVVSLCSGVEGALKDALKALNLGFLSGIIKSLIPCHDLEVTGLLCESNIVLNFPSALNAGNCLGEALTACDGNNQPIEGSTVKGVFDFLLCLLKSLTEEDLNKVVSWLLCSVIDALEKALGGLGSALQPLLTIITGAAGSQ